MEKIIQYFGQPCKVACDGNCNKAWGITIRPYSQLSDDPSDIMWLSDDMLWDAPKNPGTYEGGHGKPKDVSQFPNKWCVRECERCSMSKPGESHLPLELMDWSKNVYNIPK